MRYERLAIRHYGLLADLDTGEAPLPGMVVVHGPNEAGKSTLFSFLSSCLYGFSPASRDLHRYVPWSGEDIDGQAVVRLDSGEQLLVHRRLLSSPWGRITRGSSVEEIANRSVPWVGHVHRRVFEQLYALTQADLAKLDERAWEEIQDRLLGRMGADDLRSPREVADELEGDAKGLWRPDRVGNPRAKTIEGKLITLRAQRRSAVERDRRARELAEEIARLETEILGLRQQRSELKARKTRIEVLSPVRIRLRRIAELQGEAGAAAELAGLPANSESELVRLAGEVAKLSGELEKLEERRRRNREIVDAFTALDAALVAHAPTISSATSEAGQVRLAGPRIEGLRVRCENLGSKRDRLVRELFSGTGAIPGGSLLKGFPLGELRDHVGRYVAAREDAERHEAKLEALAELGGSSSHLRSISMFAGIAGLALFAVVTGSWLVGAVSGQVAAGLCAVAAVVLLFAALLGVLQAWSDRRHKEALGNVREQHKQRTKKVEVRRLAAVGLVSEFSLARHWLESPSKELVDQLEALIETAVALEAETAELETLQRLVADSALRSSAICEQVGIEPEVGADDLANLLEGARVRKGDSDRASEALTDLLDNIQQRETQRQEAESRLAALELALREIGEGDAREGARRAAARIDAQELAERLRGELARDHPDVEDLAKEIAEAEAAGEEWILDLAEASRVDEGLDELETLEPQLLQRRSDADHELDTLQQQPPLEAIESEILALEEEIGEVRLAHDRLSVLARVLRHSEQIFREENQPDVLRRAGSHLRAITDGRYERLLVPANSRDGSLLLQGPGYREALEVGPPISSGTTDQVYLALRLGIIDHLDAGSEALPLCVDEVFVNWDGRRFGRGLDLLEELSERRQVLLFTCHEHVAEAVSARGAFHLTLAGPPEAVVPAPVNFPPMPL
jgi:uncharacterized protein YhaN